MVPIAGPEARWSSGVPCRPSLTANSTNDCHLEAGPSGLRAYFVANLVLLAVMFPIMSGFTGLDTHTYRGLFQRMFALTVFLPVGVTSVVLGRRIRALPESYDSRSEGRPAMPQSIGLGADSRAR